MPMSFVEDKGEGVSKIKKICRCPKGPSINHVVTGHGRGGGALCFQTAPKTIYYIDLTQGRLKFVLALLDKKNKGSRIDDFEPT